MPLSIPRPRVGRGTPSPTKKAQALLKSLLTEEQQKTMKSHGYIELRGSHGGLWRIYTDGWTGNLQRSSWGRWKRHCAHPAMYIGTWGGSAPTEDAWIAQYLAILTDEKRVRNVAL